MKDERKTWQEQIEEVADQLAGEEQEAEDLNINTSEEAEPEMVVSGIRIAKSMLNSIKNRTSISPTSAATKMASQQQQRPSESVDVSSGKLSMKSPNGEVVIDLSPSERKAFVETTLKYQQAIIKEKRASMFSTYAMAALTGLSAIAIGATLIRGCFSKDSSIDI